MNAQYLRTIPTIREFFKIDETKELQEGVRLLLEAMTEITIPSGQDVVTANINVNYRAIAYVGDHLEGHAWVSAHTPGSRAIHLRAELRRGETIVTEAEGVVVIVYPASDGKL